MISIIIPVFNVEDSIDECLESIVSQDRGDLEVIIVDDGSVDRSAFKIDVFVKRYSFIKYLYQENKGSGPARNLGLSVAKGNYVLFCDPDDWYEKGAIDRYREIIMQENPDLVIGYIDDYIYSVNKVLKEVRKREKVEESSFSFPERYEFCIEKVNLRSPCNKLYKLDIIRNENVMFPDIRRSQDIVFNNQYFHHVKSVKVVGETVYCRRVIDNHIYSKNLGDFSRSRYVVYKSYFELYSKFFSYEKKKELSNKVLLGIMWSYHLHIFSNPNISYREKKKQLSDEYSNRMRVILKEQSRGMKIDNDVRLRKVVLASKLRFLIFKLLSDIKRRRKER